MSSINRFVILDLYYYLQEQFLKQLSNAVCYYSALSLGNVKKDLHIGGPF